MRFTSVQDVARTAESVKAYVHEAIAVERAALKVEVAPDLSLGRASRPASERSTTPCCLRARASTLPVNLRAAHFGANHLGAESRIGSRR